MSEMFLRAIKAQHPESIKAADQPNVLRRTKREKLSDRYIGVIMRHKARGLSFSYIARDLRLPYHTVYNVYNRYKEFAENFRG